MKAFAAHGDFFASAAVAPQGASRWHLNQIYCECEAFTVIPFGAFRQDFAVCRAHNLFAYGGQILHLQPEKYFLPGTRPGRKWIEMGLPQKRQILRSFFDIL